MMTLQDGMETSKSKIMAKLWNDGKATKGNTEVALRILATLEAKTAKISKFWTFCTVIS